MYGFKKIVLSRKGFDYEAGGGYSPFDPETGKYIVLPIPVNEEEVKISNPLKFEDIKIKSNYLPGYDASNLKELIKALGRRPLIKEKESDYAHFDPWLGSCPWLDENSDHHIGALGQVGIPQKHLDKQGVYEESLFLFFSRFVPIKNRQNKLDINIDAKNLKGGVYFIYGWLRVGKVIKEFANIYDEDLKLRHPHATEEYFDKCKDKNNTIYIAKKFLFDNSTRFPGCGYFPKLSGKLLLTANNHDQKPNKWMASRWELPGFFYKQQPPTYFSKNKEAWFIKPDGRTCVVKAPARGQEFVFEESEGFCSWFEQLLREIHQ